MNEQLVKEATFVVCPWCDAPKCVGRYNCPSIIEWVERADKQEEMPKLTSEQWRELLELRLYKRKSDVRIRTMEADLLRLGRCCEAMRAALIAQIKEDYSEED